ncbi:unnamed protein product [Cyprideis torosa]|uniref:Uncharacterized protein n=1 Tax=Cyprideis torosa TaxID=163714 RepID=A0A7R8WGZ1_9CRUS|nr:unnamed protein product [Cyprideis torosa]CAG0898768.1 unnamed protein product [Cyprideis torosa]
MTELVNKDPDGYHMEKKDFLQELVSFHSRRGSSLSYWPRISGKEIDLYLLYHLVTREGGMDKINQKERGWANLLPYFDLDSNTLNGNTALKYIYMRYLNHYERATLHGDDSARVPDAPEEDSSRGVRRKQSSLISSVPMSYNKQQHDVSLPYRKASELSTDLYLGTDYDHLCLSLLSPLPNEQDFAINICILLANEGKNMLRFKKNPLTLDLILFHAGFFKDSTLETLHTEYYKETKAHNMIRFWEETIQDTALRSFLMSYEGEQGNETEEEGNAETPFDVEEVAEEDGSTSIFGGARAMGVHDKEGQRVTQVALMLRNASFEKDNAVVMAATPACLRFLLGCIYCNWGQLPQLGWDTLANISSEIDLSNSQSLNSAPVVTPAASVTTGQTTNGGSAAGSATTAALPVIEEAKPRRVPVIQRNLLQTLVPEMMPPTSSTSTVVPGPALPRNPAVSRFMIQTLSRALISTPDRMAILGALDTLTHLAKKPENHDALTSQLPKEVYPAVCDLLSLQDIYVLIMTLECLYALSAMGTTPCEAIAKYQGTVSLLMSMVTTEAQSYGATACIGMRIVETVVGGAPSVPASSEGLGTKVTTPAVPNSTAPATQGTPTITQQQAAAAVVQHQQLLKQQQIAQTAGSTGSTGHIRKPVASSGSPLPPAATSNYSNLSPVDRDAEQFANSYLRSNVHLEPGVMIEQNAVYRHYISCASQAGKKQVLQAAIFIQTVRSIFGSAVGPISKPGGRPGEHVYVGIRIRSAAQTPVAATPSTSTVLRASTNALQQPSEAAPPVVQQVSVSPSPQPSVSPRVATPPAVLKPQESPTSPILKAHLTKPPTPTPSASCSEGNSPVPPAIQFSQHPHLSQALRGSQTTQLMRRKSGPLSPQQPPTVPDPSNTTSSLIKSLLANKVTSSPSPAPPSGAVVRPPRQHLAPIRSSSSASPGLSSSSSSPTLNSMLSQPVLPPPPSVDRVGTAIRPPLQRIPSRIITTATAVTGVNQSVIRQKSPDPSHVTKAPADSSDAGNASMVSSASSLTAAVQGVLPSSSPTPSRAGAGLLAEMLDKSVSSNGVSESCKEGVPESTVSSSGDGSGVGVQMNGQVSTAELRSVNRLGAGDSASSAGPPSAKKPRIMLVRKVLNGGEGNSSVNHQMEQLPSQFDGASDWPDQWDGPADEGTAVSSSSHLVLPHVCLDPDSCGEPGCREAFVDRGAATGAVSRTLVTAATPAVYQQSTQRFTAQAQSATIVSAPQLQQVVMSPGPATGQQVLVVRQANGQQVHYVVRPGGTTAQASTAASTTGLALNSAGQLVLQQQPHHQAAPQGKTAIILVPSQQTASGNSGMVPVTSTVSSTLSQQVAGGLVRTSQGIQVRTASAVPSSTVPTTKYVTYTSSSSSVPRTPSTVATVTTVPQTTLRTAPVKISSVPSPAIITHAPSKPAPPAPQQPPTPKVIQQATATASPSTPVSSPAPLSPNGTKPSPKKELMCEWKNCHRLFRTPQGVFHHAIESHCPATVDEGPCLWDRCDGMRRKRFSLMTHVQERHCSENALRAAIVRRRQMNQQGRTTIPDPAPVANHPGYAPNAAMQAIRRHAMESHSANVQPQPDEQEGPVTKSIRLTAALILRNLCLYSDTGRRLLQPYERQLTDLASTKAESSRTVAQILGDLSNTSPVSPLKASQTTMPSVKAAVVPSSSS